MLKELRKRIQNCCATLRRSRNKRNVGSCWLKSLTVSNFAQTQQHATRWTKGRNMYHLTILGAFSSPEPVVSWSRGRETRGSATDRLQIKASGSGDENVLGVVGQESCVRLHGALLGKREGKHGITGLNRQKDSPETSSRLSVTPWDPLGC